VAHVLIAEPKRTVAEAIRDVLSNAHHTVTLARSGAEVWDALSEGAIELLVLSLELRGNRGKELLRRIRGSSTHRRLPVIARCEAPDEIDRVLAFELGADDLVSAQSSLRELALRVRAVLRRANGRRKRRDRDPIALGSLEFRPASRELHDSGIRTQLTPIETRLLATLVERPDQVWRREELLLRVWAQMDVDQRTVDSQVRRLRGKMGNAAHLLETVRGVGYRLRTDRQAAQSPPD